MLTDSSSCLSFTEDIFFGKMCFDQVSPTTRYLLQGIIDCMQQKLKVVDRHSFRLFAMTLARTSRGSSRKYITTVPLVYMFRICLSAVRPEQLRYCTRKLHVAVPWRSKAISAFRGLGVLRKWGPQSVFQGSHAYVAIRAH
jgi:hypothetical protein